MDAAEIVELVKAISAGAKFAGSLRSAEEQDAKQGDFVTVKIESVGEAMFKFGDAAVGGGGTGEALLTKRLERLANGSLVEFHHRVTIGFLVRSVEQRVQRKRIVFGRGDLFFDERTKNTGFNGRERVGHAIMIHNREAPRCLQELQMAQDRNSHQGVAENAEMKSLGSGRRSGKNREQSCLGHWPAELPFGNTAFLK